MKTIEAGRVCPGCRRPLSPPRDGNIKATLEALKGRSGEVRLIDLANAMEESRQATSYRLKLLQGAGLASSRVEGRSRLWRAL